MRDVDWNKSYGKYAIGGRSRPSYEGRGLKSHEIVIRSFQPCVVPLMRDVDWNSQQVARSACTERRPSYEGRGLKYNGSVFIIVGGGRPSYEGRGLKLV